MLGYKTQKVAITINNQNVSVTLTENATSLDEVVVSASRTPERIMESPVTVERMDIRAIRNTSSPSFYDGLENLKGVDINSNSLTFKSVNTRGFATFSNERFMQLVDGMDNSSPALNFALGNLLGMSELDVKTIELLPGASSALYGANAFNGIMFMTSKSPFDAPGVSFVMKSGLTSQDAAGVNEIIDTSVRIAHVFSEEFAAKATISYLEGTDWNATDYRDETNPASTSHAGNPAYNGLNVYGDEVGTNIPGIGRVTRTGYTDNDLMDNEAKSLKLGVSLNYRPYGDDRLEFIFNSKYGTGNTIYQGQNRYNIKNFQMFQNKLEVRGKDFFIRGYVTSENAGDSYDTRFAAININRLWKSDKQWFTEFGGALGGFIPGVPGGNPAVARAFADRNRLIPGTAAFDTAKAKITADPSLVTGSKFQDESKIYHADANMNLREYIDFADVQVGGSYRQYSLNSFGTIFTDYNGPITYNEFGAYVQIQDKFMDDRLKVTASGRYDKAQNFKGNVSPRLSLAYAAGEDRNHNFRGSIQTGFRNPTTQDQYIGLDAGSGILIGTAPDNINRYRSLGFALGINPALAGYINAVTGGAAGIGTSKVLTGSMAYYNSWTASSVGAFVAAGGTNPGLLKKSNVDFVKPEHVTAFEVGYRGVIEGFTVDVNMYYNKYKDFIASENVVAPLYGSVALNDAVDLGPATGGAAGVTPLALIALQSGDYKGIAFDSNSDADITSAGLGLSVGTKVFNGYDMSFNYSFAKFGVSGAPNPDFEAGFNTPKHKFKLQFGKSEVVENLGFNVNFRWQDSFLWQSAFYDGTIDARSVFDAQLNYRLPEWKATIKVGGANLGGKEYFSAPGVGAIGSQYYISWTMDL
jgi:iron complex outermembrane receptor protein